LNKHFIAALILSGASAFAMAEGHEFTNTNTTYALQDVQEWKEGPYTLPDYPKQAEWVGFFVPLSDYHFYVDAKTLTLGNDGVIRLILRMSSKAGAENLSYEGFQCANRTTRAYAFGDDIDKVWTQSTRAAWNRLQISDPVRVRLVEDLCPDWNTPRDAGDALTRLKRAPWL